MNKKNIKIQLALLVIGLVLFAGDFQNAFAQQYKWICVGQLQSFFEDYGTECELVQSASNNYFTWPSQYGDNQFLTRAKGVWMGATNFYDPVEKKTKSVKVIGAGPRNDPTNRPLQIFSQTIKLIGREAPPAITVLNNDGIQNGTSNSLYDVLDNVDPNLPCDRMIVITYNTSMGISVTKKVLGFTQQNHDSYFINDYVFKNTGIYNTAGDTLHQTITNFWVYFNYRYSINGVVSNGSNSAWGAFGTEWGSSTESDDFGPPYRSRPDSLRCFYSFYAPFKGGVRQLLTSLGFDYDWGCPKQNGGGTNLDGLLGAAKYVGCVTLLASKGPGALFNVDDYNQPRTDNFFNPDGATCTTPQSQYDESAMNLRWDEITEGQLPKSLWNTVGDGRFYADWYGSDPIHPAGGMQGQGYGPYTLAPGDSIHIVFAEGANGISWEKCREVGANWYQYFAGTGTPTLIDTNGSNITPPAHPYCYYQRSWVFSGIDSIIQTFKNARTNFRSGYNIPKAPPPPSWFKVLSGGDRIQLLWADNADAAPHFNGYVIYRANGVVKDYRAVYEKVFEFTGTTNVPHSFDDTAAVRGFNYYYYIQSKDDGTQNEVKPGVPLYSSLFLTMTTVSANLLRPAGNLLGEVRVVPNPYDIRARKWQFGETGPYDRIMFYGIPPKCRLKIFSEDGALIWEKLHTNNAGDEAWDSKTSSNQIVVSGIYILYVEVTEDYYAPEDKVARYDITDENLKKMYSQGQTMFKKGDKIFTAGQSTFRKFVVIR